MSLTREKKLEADLVESRKKFINETVELHIDAIFDDVLNELEFKENDSIENALKRIFNISWRTQINVHFLARNLLSFTDLISLLKKTACEKLSESISARYVSDLGKEISFSRLNQVIKDDLQKIKKELIEKIDKTIFSPGGYDINISKLKDIIDKNIPKISQYPSDSTSLTLTMESMLFKTISYHRYLFNTHFKCILRKDRPLNKDNIDILFDVVKYQATSFLKDLDTFSEKILAKSFVALKKCLEECRNEKLTVTQKIELINQLSKLYEANYRELANMLNKLMPALSYVHKGEQRPLIMVDAALAKTPYLKLDKNTLNIIIILLDDAIQKQLDIKPLNLVVKHTLEYIQSRVLEYFFTDPNQNGETLKKLLFTLAFARWHAQKEQDPFAAILQGIEKDIRKVLPKDTLPFTKGDLVVFNSLYPYYTLDYSLTRTPRGILLSKKDIAAKTFPTPDKKEQSTFKDNMPSYILKAGTLIAKPGKPEDYIKNAMLYMLREALITYRDASKEEEDEDEREKILVETLVISILYVNQRLPKSEGAGSLPLMRSMFGASERREYWTSLEKELGSLFTEGTLNQMKEELCSYERYEQVLKSVEKHVLFAHLEEKCDHFKAYLTANDKGSNRLQASSEASVIIALIIDIITRQKDSLDPNDIENLAICLRHANTLFGHYLSEKTKTGVDQFLIQINSHFRQLIILFCEQYPDVWNSCMAKQSIKLSKESFYLETIFPAFDKMYNEKFSKSLEEKGYLKTKLNEIESAIQKDYKEKATPGYDQKSTPQMFITLSNQKTINMATCIERTPGGFNLLKQYVILSSLDNQGKIVAEAKKSAEKAAAEAVKELDSAARSAEEAQAEAKEASDVLKSQLLRQYLLALYIKHNAASYMNFIDVSYLVKNYLNPILDNTDIGSLKGMIDHRNLKESTSFFSVLPISDRRKLINTISYSEELKQYDATIGYLKDLISREKNPTLLKEAQKKLEKAQLERAEIQKKIEGNQDKIAFFKDLFSDGGDIRLCSSLKEHVGWIFTTLQDQFCRLEALFDQALERQKEKERRKATIVDSAPSAAPGSAPGMRK